jgi:ATP-dependent Clp protease ATP-binding subunit ClpA
MHLFTAIAQGSGAASLCLRESGFALKHIQFRFDDVSPIAPGSVQHVLNLATTTAKSLGHEHVDTTHLLLALIDEECNITTDVLRRQNIDLVALRGMIKTRIPDPPFPLSCALERYAHDADVRSLQAQIDDAKLGRIPMQPSAKMTAEKFHMMLEIKATNKLHKRLRTLWDEEHP